MILWGVRFCRQFTIILRLSQTVVSLLNCVNVYHKDGSDVEQALL